MLSNCMERMKQMHANLMDLALSTANSNMEIEEETTLTNSESPNLAATSNFVTIDSEPMTTTTNSNNERNQDNYVYNVPDGMEKNPEIIRAELLFYNTPQMEAYSEQVYTALLNVQEQCEVDYQKLCTPAPSSVKAEYIDLQELANSVVPTFTMFMLGQGRRQRRLLAEKSKGKEMIDSFRSYYLPQSMLTASTPGVEELKKEVSKAVAGSGLVEQQKDSKNTVESMKGPSSVRSNIMINGRLSKEGRRFADGHLMPNKRGLRSEHHDHEDHHDHHHDRDHHDHHKDDHDEQKGYDPDAPIGPGGINPNPGPYDPNAPIGPGGVNPFPTGPEGPYGPGGEKPYPPPPPRGGVGKPRDEDDYSPSAIDDDSPRRRDRRPRRDHSPPPPPPPENPYEDHFFPGALGFGAGGDLCMYKHVDSLSSNCLDAIGNVHDLREQYWHEDTSARTHHAPFLLLFFAFLGFFYVMKRCCFWKRRKAVHQLLVGLDKDPELKAQVESRLGVVVPQVKCPHSDDQNRSCCSKVLTVLGVFFTSLIASFFITITSLEMTAAIIHHMDEHNPDGEGTSPPVALLILFLICSAQVALFAFVIHKLKQCYRRNQEQFAASAPPTPTVVGPNYSHSTTNNNDNNGNSTPGVQYVPMRFRSWIAPRLAAVSSVIGNFGRRVNTTINTPSGYVPLNGDETEMISVGSTHGSAPNAPRYAVFTGVPVMTNQYGVSTPVVPVQATPVNSVSFV